MDESKRTKIQKIRPGPNELPVERTVPFEIPIRIMIHLSFHSSISLNFYELKGKLSLSTIMSLVNYIAILTHDA